MSDSTALQPFDFKGNQVRVTVIDDTPWFVAADVAAALGYGGGARNAVGRVPERMKGVAPFNTPGGLQKLAVLNESGVYRLVMRAQTEHAEAFQDWIAEEVLPSIRQTGGYVAVPAAGNALDVLKQQALMNLATVERLIEVEAAQREIEARLGDAEDRLASVEGRRDWITAVAYSLQHRLPVEHCTHAFLNRLGGVAGRIGRSWNLQPEKARDEKYGYVNMWPVDVWDAAYGELGRRGV